MSQKTTLKPLLTTASAVEIHEFTGTIISEFFFKFKDWTAISRASVPFANDTQYFTFRYFLKLFSNILTSPPPTKFDFLSKNLFS